MEPFLFIAILGAAAYYFRDKIAGVASSPKALPEGSLTVADVKGTSVQMAKSGSLPVIVSYFEQYVNAKKEMGPNGVIAITGSLSPTSIVDGDTIPGDLVKVTNDQLAESTSGGALYSLAGAVDDMAKFEKKGGSRADYPGNATVFIVPTDRAPSFAPAGSGMFLFAEAPPAK